MYWKGFYCYSAAVQRRDVIHRHLTDPITEKSMEVMSLHTHRGIWWWGFAYHRVFHGQYVLLFIVYEGGGLSYLEK